MSIIEDMAARIRATSDELPVAQLMKALDHLQGASERLRWVRQESVSPMGVPELSAAVEHAETAGHALRVAQEQLAAYLAAIGMGNDQAPPAPQGDRADRRRTAGTDPGPEPPAPAAGPATPDPVRRWWPSRVAELTGHQDDPARQREHRVGDAEELLRRISTAVRSGDRGRMHAELRDADTDIGLGLAAAAPPMLRELATELLGRPPRAQDQARLRREAGDLRDLLPGLPPSVLDTLLTRICRMPPPEQAPQRPHPADPAVAAAVLTGLLLRRLGHAPPPPVPPGRATPPQRPAPPAAPVRPARAPQPRRETHG